MVRRRISDISCNKEYFNKAAPAHKNAFKFSGFNENIQFTSTPSPRRNRNRKTNSSIHHIVSMWKPTSIEICMTSTSRHHKYHKLFNRNNIKISYSCMPNMASVIPNHNTSLLKDPTPTYIKGCSCQQKTECPLDKVFIWISNVERFSWSARH